MSEASSRFLKPAANLYRLGVGLRNRAYESGWLEVVDSGKPVVSVGNITAGGTGKTPFTKRLAESLLAKGRNVAIVSRGYKSASENLIAQVKVEDLASASRLYGDEPTMLAHQIPRATVFVGANKADVAKHAVAKINPDVLIADDAFQHRRLKRNADIVLLDATEPWWHFQMLPAGRLREPFSGLSRADIVVFTKVNLADAARLQRLKDAARANVDSSRLPVFIDLEFRIQKFATLSQFQRASEPLITPNELSNERLFLLSAIGRPAAFKSLIEKETGAQVVGSREFRDHALLSKSEIAQVITEAKRMGATQIVITEKDAVKLDAQDFAGFEPLVSSLTAVPQSDWNVVYERLVQLGI